MNNASPMKVYRIAAGLSQVQLAELVASYQGRISRIERGARPSEEEVERIAATLGVCPDDLFPEGSDR